MQDLILATAITSRKLISVLLKFNWNLMNLKVVLLDTQINITMSNKVRLRRNIKLSSLHRYDYIATATFCHRLKTVHIMNCNAI